jgi:photosystem II stability/assembly factor-like uncharacterized protein
MNRKVIARSWLVVVLLSVSLLPTLSPQAQEQGLAEHSDVVLTASGEVPSSVEAASVREATLQATTLVSAGIPAYGSQPWVSLGGPPGGLGYDIRMRPDDPDVMYVTVSPGGIFKSIDGGQTWFSVNEGIKLWGTGSLVYVFCATIDPHDYDTVWVGTQFDAHIYRSVDGGQTWEQRDNGIIPIAGEHSVRGITVDPVISTTVYAALEEYYDVVDGFQRVRGEVYKSTNAGQNWTRIWHGDDLTRYIWIDPNNTQRVFVSAGIFDRAASNSNPTSGVWGGVGVLRSEDGGGTWTELDENNGLDGGLYIPSLFMHPDNPDVLLAAVTGVGGRGTNPGAYLTQDGGDTWESILSLSTAEAVEIATSDPNVWYVASQGLIYRSDDAGQTWQEFPLKTADRESGIPIDLQVDPRDAKRIFLNSYGGGNMLSTDGGETWMDASRGYTGATIGGLAVAPGTGRTVFAGANTATFRSKDGGRTWLGTPLPTGMGGAAAAGTETILFYPSGNGSGAEIIASGGQADGNVYHSADGGTTWISSTVVSNLVVPFLARALAVAPSDPQIVYIGYADRACLLLDWVYCVNNPPGFFRSGDGGYTWEPMTSVPFTNTSILNLAVSPDDALTLYAATMAGPYRSQDGGGTWQPMEVSSGPSVDAGVEAPSVFVFAVDPFDSQVIYAGSPDSGVYRSQDGGDTWVQASAGMDANEPITHLLPDPNREGVIYASSTLSGVFVSTDGAQTWQQIAEGLTALVVDRLALSEDGTVLYAGTRGGGVFRLGTPPTEIYLPLVVKNR